MSSVSDNMITIRSGGTKRMKYLEKCKLEFDHQRTIRCFHSATYLAPATRSYGIHLLYFPLVHTCIWLSDNCRMLRLNINTDVS